jgi:hypothetical protein
MDPLITTGVEPVLPRGLEKRAGERDPVPRRKRPVVRVKTVDGEEEFKEEPGPDVPQHKLDDLA